MNYAKAKVFWDGQRMQQKQMEPSEVKREIDEFLHSQKICCIATGYGMSVRSTTMQYLYNDGCLWFLTEGGHKFDGLEMNKNVSISVFTTDRAEGENIGLQVAGVAEIYGTDSDEFDHFINVRKIKREAVEKLGHPVYVIKVEPVSYEILNNAFEKRGYGKRQMLIAE